MSVVDRALLAGPTLVAARALLGSRLVRDDATGRRIGRIVELEAYIGEDDRASHARAGRTPRTAVMFGPPGRAYVYRVYGMYDCLNIVTEPAGSPAALLVRAIEPLEGIEAMRAERLAHRSRRSRAATDIPVVRLASGPGLVGAAFGLGVDWTGIDLCDPASPLRLEHAPADRPVEQVAVGPRVGIGYAAEPWLTKPWRVWIAGHPSVSGRRARS